jgi:hypothetical protein
LLIEILVGGFLGALLVHLGHGLWLLFDERWYATRLARARTAIYSADVNGEDSVQLAALHDLPMRLRIELLVELARSLEGSTRDNLGRMARATGIVRRAERLAHSRFWWRRLRGARLLTLLGGDEILALSLLNDRHPAVRAQATEWAGQHATPAMIDALLSALGERAAFCRFAAQDALLRLGHAALAPLNAYLERAQGKSLVAALDVAIGMPQPIFAPVAMQLSSDENPKVRARAITVLGAIGGRESVDTVLRRLDDPIPSVRAAAARAIGRLGHWPGAPLVAALLRDRAWEVRLSAGLALRDLGSPGLLLLRRFESDTNLFAADMARQVLDLPATTMLHA